MQVRQATQPIISKSAKGANMEQLTPSNQTPQYYWFDTDRIPKTHEEVIDSFHELFDWINKTGAARTPPQQVVVPEIIEPGLAGNASNHTREIAFALKKKATALIQEYNNKSTISAATEADYRKKAKTLDKWRDDPHYPPQIEQHCLTANGYYAYRAALVWDTVQRLIDNKRTLDRAIIGSDAWDRAFMELKIALLDLEAYPMDRKGEGIQAYREQKALHAMGLVDASESRAKKVGDTQSLTNNHAKARFASMLNHDKPDWREVIFLRLQAIESPWRLHAAVASLTGCRPQELEGITVTLLGDGKLQFVIKGSKVSGQKGQPVRTLIVYEDSLEFAMLSEHCIMHGGDGLSFTLKAHASLANPAEAFGAAVKRAGNKALGMEFHFSAYCYRHALASDLKGDGVEREDLAVVLGHAVTETASCYGRYAGGRKNVRQVEAHGTRVVKVNHKADPTQKRVPQAQAPAGNGSGTDGAAPGSASDFPIEPSTFSPK